MGGDQVDIVRASPNGVLVVDADGNVAFANPAAEKLLGRDPGKAIGYPLGYPISSDEPQMLTLRSRRGEPAIVELRSNETVWRGERAWVVNLHDVTALKATEERLRSAAEQAEHLNRLLGAVTNVNHVITHRQDRAGVAQEVCDLLVTRGGFKGSWVILVKDGDVAEAACSWGGEQLIAALVERFEAGTPPECCGEPTPGVPVHVCHIAGACSDCPIGGLVDAEVALTAPLRHEGRTYGFLSVRLSSASTDMDAELEFVETVANDLAYAVAGIVKAEERSHMMRLLGATERVAQVGGWEWDLETDVFTFSDEWMRIHGTNERQMTRTRLLTLSHPDERDLWEAHLERARAKRLPYSLEHRIIREDTGEVRHVVARVAFPDGEWGGKRIFGISRDITAQHDAHERIHFQAAMLDAVGEAVFVADPDWVIVYWNRAAAHLFGWSPEEALGCRAGDLIEVSGGGGEVADEIQEVLRGGEARTGEYELTRKDGSAFHALVSITPVLGADGRLETVIATVSDITSLKLEEEKRRLAEASLAHSQKMESVGRLAGGVAHDFNNTLAVILGCANLALSRIPADDPCRDDFQTILDAALRGSDVTRQLLGFARKQAISPKSLDLNETVASMSRMLHHVLTEDISLDFQPDMERCPVVMDPSQVQQVLMNLVVNARDAIRGPGHITVRTHAHPVGGIGDQGHAPALPGAYVAVAVSDDGVGMNADVVERIFEPFFTTKRQGEGTGLGLATVLGIVEQNGGFVEVESTPGEGTTFRLYIPRDSGGEVGEPATAADALAAAPTSAATVLLVEDEEGIRRVLHRFLTKLGHKVVVANGPLEALDKAREMDAPIDLLVTDVIMPDMNGIELYDAMSAELPRMRCLFMSGYSADVIADRGGLPEGVAFLPKPFLIEDLDAKIREALAG